MNDIVNRDDIKKVRNHTAKILYILLGLNLLIVIMGIGQFAPISLLMLLLIPLAVLIQKGYKQFILVTMVFLTFLYGYTAVLAGSYLGVIGWSVFMYALYKAWVSEQKARKLEVNNS